MAFRRNLFTGVLEEVPSTGVGRQVIFRGRLPYGDQTVTGRRGDPWDTGRDHVDKGMSIAPDEATPGKIEQLNENAKHCNTGAYYSPDGKCYTPTRRSRAREMRARANVDYGFQDNDACYSDNPGR